MNFTFALHAVSNNKVVTVPRRHEVFAGKGVLIRIDKHSNFRQWKEVNTQPYVFALSSTHFIGR
jgi:hypothetical protein